MKLLALAALVTCFVSTSVKAESKQLVVPVEISFGAMDAMAPSSESDEKKEVVVIEVTDEDSDNEDIASR